MKRTRATNYSKQLQGVAATSSALAHPARVAILATLSQEGVMSCGSLVQELPLSQATVSQHLRKLEEAGLVIGTVEGTKSLYRVSKSDTEAAISLLSNFLERINS